ncbi:unnamed protein product [Clavelina lepadiformis]|uniref:Uncharacterized protein n=1 Tax=Clavelina lepadiformis TaxID=159417 RepID=A0ABP0H1F5_CLALP
MDDLTVALQEVRTHGWYLFFPSKVDHCRNERTKNLQGSKNQAKGSRRKTSPRNDVAKAKLCHRFGYAESECRRAQLETDLVEKLYNDDLISVGGSDVVISRAESPVSREPFDRGKFDDFGKNPISSQEFFEGEALVANTPSARSTSVGEPSGSKSLSSKKRSSHAVSSTNPSRRWAISRGSAINLQHVRSTIAEVVEEVIIVRTRSRLPLF